MKQSGPLFLGCHLSSARGYAAAGKVALEIGANTFQFFTRNPRGGSAKAIDPADAEALQSLCVQHGFGTLVAHAPYTLNPASSDPKVRDFAFRCLTEDIARMSYFPNAVYNLHPGSHVGQGAKAGKRLIATLLNEALSGDPPVTLLLETMSGHGSEVGGTLEEIADLLGMIQRPARVGVCLDTCHLFAAGYDVRSDLDGVLRAIDRIVGLGRVRAVHLNDSLFPLGAGKDRHARIGEGYIGLEALRRVVRHETLAGLPMILETPNEPAGHGDEIRLLLQGEQ